MRLAFSTNAFKKVSLEEAIDQIADAGYEGVEIMADVPHAYPPHMSRRRTKALVTQMRDLRLEVSNVNAFTFFALGDTWNPSWIDPSPKVRAQRVEHTENSLRLAAELGAAAISTEPGGHVSPKLTHGQAMEFFRLGLQMVYPLARQLDVTVLIEPEPELLLESADDFLEFIGTVPHGHVGLNFDVGHFFCVGDDPAEAARKLAPWIRHVHIEDIAPNREHKHLVPGRGAIDYAAVFRALRDIGYNGWVTVELYPYESTARQVADEALLFLQSYVR
ncbi:MAG: sugar phosphate isomerase/epimerase [Phycisphaerae bacterium]|nr:sugar phosphate isomerase/epimerase [Phycisphaerae bacterium]